MSSEIRSRSHYSEQTFKEVHMEKSQIISSEFYDCIFDHCSFAESGLRYCRFVNCIFQHCDLSLIQLDATTFSSTKFENSKAIGVDWTQADWTATRLGEPISFFNSVVSQSVFVGLKLVSIKFKGCTAVDVDFSYADLTKADFAGTDLSKSLFSNTNLTEGDLSSARNYQIPPAKNVLKQAKFSLPEAMSLLYCMDIELTEG
ncbi:pentapeptide repeat-containing protein [Acidobacteriota bacterium]